MKIQRAIELKDVPRQYHELTPYQISFAMWLQDFEFDTFGTFTTKKTLTLAGARRMAERFHREHPELVMFWAAEPFSIRTGYHFHTLMKTTSPEGFKLYSRQGFKKYWEQTKDFGFAQFQKINKKQPHDWTSSYISKYITKGLSDYDIITPTLAAKKPEQVSYYHPVTIRTEKRITISQYDTVMEQKRIRSAKRKRSIQLKFT